MSVCKPELYSVDENYLKTAEGFKTDHWPLVADRNWRGFEARNIPGERPQAVEPTAPGTTPTSNIDIKYLRLSSLTGLTVKNSQNTDIGKLDNIVLDWHNSRVAYGIVSVDRSFLGERGKLAAIPWSAIRINPEQKVALLNVDKTTLQAIAFDKDHFPNLASLQYSRDLYQRFNVRPYWEALGYVPGEQHPSTRVPGGTNPGVEHSQPMGY